MIFEDHHGGKERPTFSRSQYGINMEIIICQVTITKKYGICTEIAH